MMRLHQFRFGGPPAISRIAPCIVLALVAIRCVLFVLSPTQAHAGSIHAEYHAGPTVATSTPANVWAPELWGWLPHDVGAAAVGAVNSGGSLLNAWRITDANPSLPNPTYVTDFIPQDVVRLAADGWRMRSTIRYVANLGGGPNLGMSAYIGGQAYHMMLDLTASGDLRATLYDTSSRSYQITTGGSGTAAFHRFELLNAPGSSAVAFAVDGVVLDRTWDGISLNHPSNIQWGNSNQAGAGRGVADFQEVTFEIGPFNERFGDFNGDDVTDGSDMLLWQKTYGSTSDLAADGNGDGVVNAPDLAIWKQYFGRTSNATPAIGEASLNIPEPSVAALLLGLVPLVCSVRLRL